jgi:hypothetical protein
MDDGHSAARAAEVILHWPGVTTSEKMTGEAAGRSNLTRSKQPPASDILR